MYSRKGNSVHLLPFTLLKLKFKFQFRATCSIFVNFEKYKTKHKTTENSGMQNYKVLTYKHSPDFN